MHLTVRSSVSPPTGTVRAVGEIDIATVGLIEEALRGCLDQGCTRLCADLEAVSFMDCSGVNLLLRVRAEAERRGARLELITWSADVERIVRLAGVRSLLPPSARARRSRAGEARREAQRQTIV